ncbi:MAG: hypothetical protein JXA66_02870 [Oligoflexia bacterium]|nr:hypothetical protein [Oligoflexia bacterium]
MVRSINMAWVIIHVLFLSNLYGQMDSEGFFIYSIKSASSKQDLMAAGKYYKYKPGATVTFNSYAKSLLSPEEACITVIVSRLNDKDDLLYKVGATTIPSYSGEGEGRRDCLEGNFTFSDDMYDVTDDYLEYIRVKGVENDGYKESHVNNPILEKMFGDPSFELPEFIALRTTQMLLAGTEQTTFNIECVNNKKYPGDGGPTEYITCSSPGTGNVLELVSGTVVTYYFEDTIFYKIFKPINEYGEYACLFGLLAGAGTGSGRQFSLKNGLKKLRNITALLKRLDKAIADTGRFIHEKIQSRVLEKWQDLGKDTYTIPKLKAFAQAVSKYVLGGLTVATGYVIGSSYLTAGSNAMINNTVDPELAFKEVNALVSWRFYPLTVHFSATNPFVSGIDKGVFYLVESPMLYEQSRNEFVQACREFILYSQPVFRNSFIFFDEMTRNIEFEVIDNGVHFTCVLDGEIRMDLDVLKTGSDSFTVVDNITDETFYENP